MQDYPRVTEVIRAAGLMGDTSWYTEEARDRGTAVHKACWYLSESDLDLTTLDSRIAPRVAQFQRWIAESGFVILANEEPVVSDIFRYRGTRDIRADIGSGREAIIDIKCGPPQPWHGAQLAAYALGTTQKRYGLYLTDTDYRMVEYTARDDWSAFMSALNLFHWRARNGV